MIKKLKLHKKEILKGSWVYSTVDFGEVDVKKGENSLDIPEDKIKDGEGEIYSCVKIGSLIYDIESYENGVATLSEAIQEDFVGKVYYEASFPLIIRTKSDITSMMIEESSNFKKLKYTEKTLDTFAPKKKAFWLNKLTEAGKLNIIPTQTVILTIDEAENLKQDSMQDEIRKYLDLVIYVDMDYEFEDRTNLWEVFGIKKGNYTEVTKLLMSYGILGNDDDYFDLKYTIEAIKNKEENIALYVKTKKDEATFIMALQEMKSKLSDEDFKSFVDNLMKAGKEVEQLQP